MTERKNGFTLIEVLIAAAIFSIGIMGFLQSFSFIARAVHTTRGTTIAANLVQAEVETLKNNSYYALQVTTVTKTNNNFSPALVYSAGAYGEATVNVAGIPFLVASRVDFAGVVNGVVTTMNYTDPDPGMKQVTVYVMWQDGTKWKSLTLSNLLENPNVAPQTATITGTVRESGTSAAVAGATVKTLENPALQDLTNASGAYSFRVNAGTYTLQCSTSNFFFQVSSSMVIGAGGQLTKDWTLTRIATGTAQGWVWLNPTGPRYLITQAVASTVTYVPDLGTTQDIEYVELLNPTTKTLELSYIVLYVYRHNGSTDSPLKYRYSYGYTWTPDPTWDYMSYRSTSIPANSYFLIANTSMSFVLFNSTVTPDAWVESYYDYDGSVFSGPITGAFPSLIKTNAESSSPQALYVYSYDSTWTTFMYDELGWRGDNKKYPYLYKSDYPRCNGIQEGEQIIRYSTPAWTSSGYQRVYDTENNRYDFECNRYSGSPIPMTQRAFSTASGTQTALSGVPAYGALVSVNDTFSNSTAAYQVTIATGSGGLNYPGARFSLQGISTGTWTVDIASGDYYTTVASVTISSSNETVLVPSSNTVPAALSTYANHNVLLSTGIYGYVSGFVWDVSGAPLNGISVVAGGVPKTTNAQGFYYAAVATGTVTVIINPSNANSAYVSDTFAPTVYQGLVTNVNDNLLRGGTLKGYVTSGVSALPNINVIALLNGVQLGNGTSDTSGYFYIYNLTTGSYTAQPALDPVADASPDTLSGTVTQGSTVFLGTFTVTGAYGTITGTVKKGTSLITTGTLIIASSVTLSATPPSIVASSAPARDVYYSVSSLSDGTYTLLVRGATNFNYNIRAWYPTISGNTVTTSNVSYSGVSVTAGASTTRDITFP